ncbi:hypothetical protein OG909_10270 [Streptomyces sp. NBC_01754]|uniref:hypothetical protein n=1 Tax=Streptomyces sp. NBC_01754 TaxID=2975930 RepID=UPI002DD9D189|nr:hypothetical protein [Streptomyces sp. NBC_01754]WSC92648.1 hypothetical protein OG909_10270 [Streptomyces sp. NBC_01754]
MGYFRHSEAANREVGLVSVYGECVTWDGGVAVAGGRKAARIEVTDRYPGEKSTKDGDLLVARCADPGGDDDSLTATVTGTGA